MNKKNIIFGVFIAYVVVITVITVAIIAGKEEKKPVTAPRQFKKPTGTKTENKPEYTPGSGETIAADSEKEFEAPVKGPLLN